MREVKLGDIVRYRDWLPGDPVIDSIPEESRSWGSVGLVITLCKSKFKLGILEDAIEYIDESGDIYMARLEDVEILGDV